LKRIRVFEINQEGTAFSLVSEIDSYKSAYFTRSWSGIGEFEIESAFAIPTIKELTVGRVIMFGEDERCAGIILSRKRSIEPGGRGGEVVNVRGVELKGILAHRIIYPQPGKTPLWYAYAPKTAKRVLNGQWSYPICINSYPQTPTVAEFSIDGSTNWHSDFDSTDKYMRTRTPPDSWGSVMKISGEASSDGISDYIDYQFRRAYQQPTRPTGNDPAGWDDVPPVDVPHYYALGIAETILKQLVSSQLGPTASNVNRRALLLDIAFDQTRGTAYAIASRYGNLADACGKISEGSGLGYWIELDSGFFHFRLECGAGLDRTAGQSTNGRAIFSSRFDTLNSGTVEENIGSYANLAIVGGSGKGEHRIVSEITQEESEPLGVFRKEAWVEARDLSLPSELATAGLTKLALASNIQLDGVALQKSPLVYKRDYDLGDIVTLEAFGESWDARITEAKEFCGSDGTGVELTYGPPKAELPDQVRRALAGQANALNNSEQD
jgi:hypothetical protein